MRVLIVFMRNMIALLLMAISVEGYDMCPSLIDGSVSFGTGLTSYTNTKFLAKDNTHFYYFNIETAGTLTVSVTSSGNKVNLAFNDVACPAGSATGVFTKTVTTTSPMDFNIALFATNDATYTISVTFVPSPLGITKTSTPSQVASGVLSPVTYTLSVRNNSSATTLHSVQVSDTLPAGLAITGTTASGWSCSTSGQTVTCTLSAGSLAPGQTASDINISANANISSAVTNTATVSATEGSASSSSVLQAVSGTKTVDLEIQKFASSSVVAPNSDFAYYIFVINYSNSADAQLVRVTDTFPADANVSFVGAGGNGWSCTVPSDTNRTFVCDYSTSLPYGITYFAVNSHARDVNGTYGVRNSATVSSLNPISGAHATTAYADINITTVGAGGGTIPGGGYVQGGDIEVSDIPITATYNRSNAKIWTKVAATQNTTFDVYHVDSSTGFLSNYSPSGTTSVPLTVIFKLGDTSCSVASETYLSYDSTKSVAAVIDPNTNHAYAGEDPENGIFNYDLRNIAKKGGRLLMKYVDINQLLNVAGESCNRSSLDGNIKGLPQCIANSTGGNLDNNKYLRVFGPSAFMRCVVGNGNPCNSSNHGIGDSPYNTDYGCYECTLGGAGYCSKDSFAIRPKQFDLNITAGAVLKAQANNLAFKALTNNTIVENTLDYNETQNSTFALDLNISDATKSCAQMNLSITPTVSFADGLHLDNFRFSNIGDVNLTLHDIYGSEFAKIDENDTSDTLRLITPYTVQFRIIPHHFQIDGNFTNHSNGFTYLSNFEAYNTTLSRKMSGALDLNVTAKADTNATTTNYTNNCYAKDGSLKLGITPFTVTPTGSLSKMIWYDFKHDTNGSIPLPLPATVSIPLLHTAYDSNESNGTASVDYLINFDRNQTKVVNPFVMTIGNVDMNDSDSVTGTKALNSAVYYLYGRVNPLSTTTYGTIPPTAQSYMEAYSTAPITIGATALSASKISNVWWINRVHMSTDGDANVTIYSAPIPSYPGSNTNLPIASLANGVTAYTWLTAPTAAQLPVEFESHIKTMPWLWYGENGLVYTDPVSGNTHVDCLHHPCFIVKVRPTMSNWVGGGTEKGNKTQESTTGQQMGEDMLVPRIRQ